jgi:hypothetical protein
MIHVCVYAYAVPALHCFLYDQHHLSHSCILHLSLTPLYLTRSHTPDFILVHQFIKKRTSSTGDDNKDFTVDIEAMKKMYTETMLGGDKSQGRDEL